MGPYSMLAGTQPSAAWSAPRAGVPSVGEEDTRRHVAQGPQ